MLTTLEGFGFERETTTTLERRDIGTIIMQELAALLLCKLGGQSGSADEIKAVISAAGGEPNDDQIATLVGDLEGKDINELLSAGMEKLKDVPMGGGGMLFSLFHFSMRVFCVIVETPIIIAS